MSDLITAEWLQSVGFRWHQIDSKFGHMPEKHWVLWLGSAIANRNVDTEDLGLELGPDAYAGPGKPDEWFCWLRGDTAGRYHRFLHIRHISEQHEVSTLVEALTGQPWNPANHWCGSVQTPERMAYINREKERLDYRFRDHCPKWRDVEKDDSRGRALPEHMQAAIDGGKAK